MKAIVTLCNNSYIKLFDKWFNAIQKFTSLPIYLITLSDVDISQEKCELLEKSNCKVIQINKEGNLFFEDTTEHVCAEKLRLFKHLPNSISNILFIDVDILILDNFWDESNYFEKSNNSIMLCQDLFVGYKEKMEEEFKLFDPEFKMKFFPDQSYFYFNTGVFFASRQTHSQMFEEILTTWQRYFKQLGTHPSVFDQNVFNYFLIKHDISVEKIPIKNNCIRQYDTWTYKSQIFLEGEKVAGFHFNGGDADVKLSRWNILEKYLQSDNDDLIKTTSIIPLIPSDLYFKLQAMHPVKAFIKSIYSDKFINIIRQAQNDRSNDNIIIGVSGTVATGKTMFCKKIMATLSKVDLKQVIYLPFDLWINSDNLDSNKYDHKFFIEEFEIALNCIKNNKAFLCPRYDLVKNKIDTNIFNLSEEEYLYQGKKLKRIKDCASKYLLNEKDTLYLDITNNRIFSAFSASEKALYVIDGTLVFFNQSVSEKCYDICVHVISSWVNRISRMVRRYRRNDVYGGINSSELEYVKFLTKEAKECADLAVSTQFVDMKNIIQVNSSVESISNLLDIYYLKHLLTKNYELCQAFSLDLIKIDNAIQEAYIELKQISNEINIQAEYQYFLNNYHLLDLPQKSKLELRNKLLATFQEINQNPSNILYGYSKSTENNELLNEGEEEINKHSNYILPRCLL